MPIGGGGPPPEPGGAPAMPPAPGVGLGIANGLLAYPATAALSFGLPPNR